MVLIYILQCILFQEIEKVKKQDEVPVIVAESNNTLVTSTNNISFQPTTFLFGDKSSINIFEKNTPNVSIFGSKPIFSNSSLDSTKTDDTKSTSLFGLSSTVTPKSSIFDSFAASGSIESPNTSQTTLFSKTDDIKSKNEGLFNFSPKTDSPFKFGTISKDQKSVFGQNLFGVKDTAAVDGSTPYGMKKLK